LLLLAIFYRIAEAPRNPFQQIEVDGKDVDAKETDVRETKTKS
jgi:hypothetical protein